MKNLIVDFKPTIILPRIPEYGLERLAARAREKKMPRALLKAQGGWLGGAWEVLVSNQAAGASFASYTTAKTVLPTSCLYDLPKNWWQIGRKMRMTVIGGISNRVTGPDTTTFQFMQSAVSAFSSGAMNLTTTAHTNLPFWAECLVTCFVTGATAAVMGQWRVAGQMFAASASQADSASSHGFLLAPNTAPANGTAFDSTAVQTVDFFAAQSFSGSGNGIQVSEYLLEAQ